MSDKTERDHVTGLMKRCRCPEHDGPRWLPATVDYFGRCGTLADGSLKLKSYCRPCYRQRERARGPRNRPSRAQYYRDYRRDVLQADPEKRALVNAARRRRRCGTDVFLRPNGGGGFAAAAPIREAVARARMDCAAVSVAAGYEESTLAKALKRDTVTMRMALRVLAVIDVLPAEVGL